MSIVQSYIPSRTYSTIFFMENPDTLVFRSIFIADAARSIRTTIIYKKHFPIDKSLGKDTFNTTR